MERYLGSQNEEAVNAYCDLAIKNKLTPTQLALSWCYHNELVASSIIGATTMDQLKENLSSIDVTLDPELIKKINEIHEDIPNPST